MKNKPSIRTLNMKDEKGSVLIVALLMIVFLSLLGIASTTTSTVEVQIAGNDRNYKQNLYRAEAAAMEAAQRLDNETDTLVLENKSHIWLHDNDMMTVVNNWDFDNVGGDDNSETVNAGIDPDSTTHFSVVDMGIAPGSSLSMGDTNLHEFAIYGLTQTSSGETLVEIGFRKRF